MSERDHQLFFLQQTRKRKKMKLHGRWTGEPRSSVGGGRRRPRGAGGRGVRLIPVAKNQGLRPLLSVKLTITGPAEQNTLKIQSAGAVAMLIPQHSKLIWHRHTIDEQVIHKNGVLKLDYLAGSALFCCPSYRGEKLRKALFRCCFIWFANQLMWSAWDMPGVQCGCPLLVGQ